MSDAGDQLKNGREKSMASRIVDRGGSTGLPQLATSAATMSPTTILPAARLRFS